MSAHRTARLLSGLFGMALSAVCLGQGMSPVAAPAMQPGAPFLTGGVGQDELDQLKEQAAGYNVRILFAEQGGAFISGVTVMISGPAGQPVVQVASGGPFLFVKLPAGSYEIKATHEGVSQARRLTVGSKGRSEMTIRW
jgi:hypothetical protein